MRVQIASSNESSPVLNVSLRQTGDEVFVEVATGGLGTDWTIFGLRENEGKLVGIVYKGINDKLIDTDEDGRIKTVEED